MSTRAVSQIPTLNHLSINTPRVSQYSGADVNVAIWAMVEISIGIVSASLPTMRPIYNLIVRGHHCTSYDYHCALCERSRAAGDWRSKWRISRMRWPGSLAASATAVSEAEEGLRGQRSIVSSSVLRPGWGLWWGSRPAGVEDSGSL